MTQTAPLLSRQADDPISWLIESVACFNQAPGLVTASEFLHHTRQLSRALPAASHVINLCDNRYLFMVALCAAVVRGQISLLPSNKNPLMQQNLSKRYAGTYVIHDGITEIADLQQCDLSSLSLCGSPGQLAALADRPFHVPEIAVDSIAAITFTSGSTGDAKPIVKSWQTLVESTAMNCRYMLPNRQDIFYLLATVPPQHMWGFETTVLMPLFANACVADARPFYPHDIRKMLGCLPRPRALISTPLHLRALQTVKSDMPPLDLVLSATAPLSQQLASAIEEHFATQVREIYGCSEVGSMAVRRTSKTAAWEEFDRLNFAVAESGSTVVSAPHLPAEVQLEDSLQALDDGHFLLLGRASDQINIAGKRGSLQEVNRVLSLFPGLQDGIVFLPPGDRSVARLAALVVLPQTVDNKRLRAHFRRHLDAAFVPRPIIQVASLPREENGKLVKAKLLEFYQSQFPRRTPVIDT